MNNMKENKAQLILNQLNYQTIGGFVFKIARSIRANLYEYLTKK